MSSGSGDIPPGSNGEEHASPKTDNATDTFIATIILGAAVIFVIFLGGYYFLNKNNKAHDSLSDFLEEATSDETFKPPQHKAAYNALKAKLSEKKSGDPESQKELKKALMNRAIHTIPLLYELQTKGPTADRLYKKGVLTDEMHDQLKELKAYIDVEFPEVQEEANKLLAGWGESIWPQANQFYQLYKSRKTNEDGFANDDESTDDISDSIPTSLIGGVNATNKAKNEENSSSDHKGSKSSPNIPTATYHGDTQTSKNTATNANTPKGKKKKDNISDDLAKVDTGKLTEAEQRKHAEQMAKSLMEEEERATKGKKKGK